VTLDWEFIGDEIPDTELRIRRQVWADDRGDLDSPMHYTVEVLEGRDDPDDELSDLKPADRRVFRVLEQAGEWLDVTAIGDATANDRTGLPALKKRTIQDSCKTLVDANLADVIEIGRAHSHKWRSCARDACARDADEQ
jgi:hypothetical protein